MKKLKPEDRVRIVVEMADVVSSICADSIRDRNPRASEEELVAEMRKRINSGRRRGGV